MQVRQDKQLAMTFPFAVFCHYSEQFFVSQAEQFSDGLSGQKQQRLLRRIQSESEHYPNMVYCVYSITLY